MHILYVFGGCSPTKYREYVESKGLRVQQQSQKYNLLLAEGFAANGAKVSAISSRPINRAVDKSLFFRAERDEENGVTYHYVSFVNVPALRKVTVFLNTFFRVLFARLEKERVVVCDALNIAASLGTRFASRLRGIKALGIVTDVPCHRPNNQRVSRAERINLWLMKQFDGYLLLTEQMNDIVNLKKRPHIVLEGHADVAMQQVENRLSDKHEKRVCLYAGTLRRIYGIEALVRGFMEANIPNAELHIYGDGDFRSELEHIVTTCDSVKYMGVVPNSVIVEEELKATLLINPRPTGEEYTKYSFPSKNMEYMASGTPVLTTKLPGMPGDHLPHVFLIEDETSKGIREALTRILSQSSEKLHAFGTEAKRFVLENKNNCAQAKKVIAFMSDAQLSK